MSRAEEETRKKILDHHTIDITKTEVMQYSPDNCIDILHEFSYMQLIGRAVNATKVHHC
jgi:hypothetical protein